MKQKEFLHTVGKGVNWCNLLENKFGVEEHVHTLCLSSSTFKHILQRNSHPRTSEDISMDISKKCSLQLKFIKVFIFKNILHVHLKDNMREWTNFEKYSEIW